MILDGTLLDRNAGVNLKKETDVDIYMHLPMAEMIMKKVEGNPIDA